jgi:transcriptional regulator with XRE-family HTH domain
MSFAETIKTLRRDSGLTQERLAEILSISPQAVSRWETGVAMPDISLIPPIANLFGVTTDHLLGMETYQKDMRKAEFDEAFFEYWKHDDKQKNYEIAVQAAAEYPGNMEYVEWLASAEYYVAFSKPEDEYKRLLESSVSHYNIVIDNTKDTELLDKALSGIVLSLCMLGRKAEAKDYAERIQNEHSRNDSIGWCLEGEEQIRHYQKTSEESLNDFIYRLSFAPAKMEVCEAVEKILAILFPDGNYQYYHNRLQYSSITKAMLLCRESHFDEAIETLQKAKYHAEEMTKCSKKTEYRFTAPLFNRLSIQKPISDAITTDVEDFHESLTNNRDFDSIRDREDFKALYH